MEKDNKRVSLPVLIWHWLRDMGRKTETAVFRWMLYRHGIRICPQEKARHTYWMNIVVARGGGEQMKPCEFIFETPWQAAMHAEVTKSCPTWNYVTTIEIRSDVELTTTDYAMMLDTDEYMQLVEQMRHGEADTIGQELKQDRERIDRLNRQWIDEVEAAKHRWQKRHGNG